MDTGMQRILVVDDEVVIASTLGEIFERNGFEVRVAYSGREALAVLVEFRPDVLLTDYSMNEMNGYELATKVVAQLPGCRVFVLTACVDLHRLPKVELQPEMTVLFKPIGPATLVRSITEQDIPATATSPTVLCVDDVEPHRYSISRMLMHYGFQVIEAGSGEDALRKVDAMPDAVLLDLNMPDMDGFEVCREIRSRFPSRRIPVLHLTSTYHNSEAAERSRQAGADDYLEQPVSPQVLVTRLRQLAQRSFLNN